MSLGHAFEVSSAVVVQRRRTADDEQRRLDRRRPIGVLEELAQRITNACSRARASLDLEKLETVVAGTHDDVDRLAIAARMLVAHVTLAELGDQLLAQRVLQQVVLEADVKFALGKRRGRAGRAGRTPRSDANAF